jgi:hypothetical protein
MRTLSLRRLADVQMGYSFRTGVESNPSAQVGVIQMKDLGDDHIVDLGSLARVTLDVRPDLRVREGDVIFRSRGDRPTCAIVADDPGCTVIAAPLLRLRVTDPRIMPAYLNWLINHPSAQARLARHAEGTYVKMISKRSLEDLEIDVPTLERQRRIVELSRLSARECILRDDRDALRERMVSVIMMSYAQGGAAQ